MSSRIRVVMAGVAAVAAVPMAWLYSAGATATPAATPSPVVDVSAASTVGWTPEAVEEHNRSEEALAAHLRERGFACEVKSNQHGLEYTDFDAHDEAVNKAVDEFWEEYLRDN